MNKNIPNELNQILDLYRDDLINQKHSPEIVSIYCDKVRCFLLWWSRFGNANLRYHPVTRDDVKMYRQELMQSQVPAACNQALAALRIFFSFLQKSEIADRNPIIGIANVWDLQKAYSWLDKDQQRQLETAIDLQLRTPFDLVAWQENRIRSAALVRFLLHTGMRASEARTVRVGDTRLGETMGVVHIRGMEPWYVQVDSPTCTALKVWLEIRPEAEIDWLWVDKYKRWPSPISDNGILRACRRMAEAAGLPPQSVTPRILRNTCAYNLLVAGLTPGQVKRRLRFSATKYVRNYLKISTQ